MALAFISKATSSTSSATSLTYAQDCTGANILIVAVGHTKTVNVSSVTYNGTNLTNINSQAGTTVNGKVELWYLLAPTTGSNNIVITMASASKIVGQSSAYSGAKQSIIPDAQSTTSETTTTSFSQSITTSADNCWGIMCGIGDSGLAVSAGTNTTIREQETAVEGMFLCDTNSVKTPAGTDTLNVTSSSQIFFGCAISLSPSLTPTVNVKLWGGGGGGGGVSGSGGGSGSYVNDTLHPFTSGVGYTVTIGQGGTGGSTTAGSGGAGAFTGGNGSAANSRGGGGGGGSTKFDNLIASGGGGGAGDSATGGVAKGASGTSGGTGATADGSHGAGGGGAAGTNGTNASGSTGGAGGTGGTIQTGTNGDGNINNASGGGSSAGTSGNGANGGASAGATGSGGATHGTNGANGESGGGGSVGNPGENGGVPGAGAGGASSGTGGTGGNGIVIITSPIGIITSATGGTHTTSGGNDIWTFTTSGTWTPTISTSSGNFLMFM